MHYDKNDPQAYRNAMGRYKTRKQLTFIQRFLPRPDCRVLDLGGGNGRLAVPLADLGHHVTVVDESELALDLLARENHPRIQCIHSDALDFEGSQGFDVAILVDALKYMDHAPLVTLFTTIADSLVDNGIFVLIEMNTGSWRYHLNRLLGRVCPYNISSHSGYLDALDQSGFRWLQSRGSHFMPFTYNSNSPLVGVCAALERWLLLDRWASQGPWVMVASQKSINQWPFATHAG